MGDGGWWGCALSCTGVNSGDISQQVGRSLKAARISSGLSLAQLADHAELSKSILARIERGDGNPSIETLWRIARALDVPLGALLDHDDQPRVRRIPTKTGEPLRGHSGLAAWLIHADGRGHRTEVFEIDLPPLTDHRAEAHQPGAEEVVVCMRGAAWVGPIGEEVALKPGDSAWFVADGPHGYRAGARGATVLDLVMLPVVGA